MASSLVGKTLSNRYVIEEMLGQGGMSAVYKATDPNLKRVVAIKVIHSHLSSDKDFVKRFDEEAAAVAQLRHPGIIQVHDFNRDDDTYYMVLEFVPGETFQDHLKRLTDQGRNAWDPSIWLRSASTRNWRSGTTSCRRKSKTFRTRLSR